MDIVGIILWMLLSLVGIAGAILPGLPGPQLGYIALIIIQFSLKYPFSRRFIVLWWVIIIGLLLVDYLLPLRWTKKFGGSKRGNTWCLIGMFLGLFAGPLGILIGPFLGALLGEYLYQQDAKKSLISALGAFLGFASGIIIKLITSIIMLGYLLSASIQHFM